MTRNRGISRSTLLIHSSRAPFPSISRLAPRELDGRLESNTVPGARACGPREGWDDEARGLGGAIQ